MMKHSSPASTPTKVLMLCTGVGRMNRGIETFFIDAFEGIRNHPDLDVTLVIGAGSVSKGQKKAISLSRNGLLTSAIAKLVNRDSYTVEQLSSIPSMLWLIERVRPNVVFTSEANLAPRLRKLRAFMGAEFKIMYSNGAPMEGPFKWADYVHQVTPTYKQIAVDNGDEDHRHILVPYGFTVPGQFSNCTPKQKENLRHKLGLPTSRKIILSVGWISRKHKRMDYLIDEVARLPEPRPLLVMLGAMDEQSESIIHEAKTKLGSDGVIAKSVDPEEVSEWYSVADVFALASLREGFGRVYIEAMMSGLPVLCHDYPVGKYVCGEFGLYGDFAKEGGLERILTETAGLFESDQQASEDRWRFVRDTYGWKALADKYASMFKDAAQGTVRK